MIEQSSRRWHFPELRSFRDRNPYAVGLITVLIIGAAVGFAFMVGLLHLLDDTYTVKAIFTDGAGVRNGDDVRVAGVNVGRVSGISADRVHGNVVITMEVDSGTELGRDTTAELALTTLLGKKFVRLDGPVVAPMLEDLPKEERVIPVERTKVPFDIFELTTTATRSIEATENEKLNKLITSFADITQGKREEIGALITAIDEVASQINARDVQVRSLLDRFDRLSGLLADKDQTLVELVDQSRDILNLISARRDEISRGLERGAVFTSRLSGVIGTHKSALDAILETLHPTLQILDEHQKDVDRALAWLGPGSLGLARAGGFGPWTEIYVRALGPDVLAILGDVLGTAP